MGTYIRHEINEREYMIDRSVVTLMDDKGQHKLCICKDCRLYKPETPKESCTIERRVTNAAHQKGMIAPILGCCTFARK